MALVIRYSIFAAIATLANILSQSVAAGIYRGRYELYFSMLAGTLIGLIVKYVLDKKYIFYYTTGNLVADGQKFILYSLMGVLTTFVFWGTELSFDFIFASRSMRYTGAAIGLCVGYWLKYQLDKRFVFAGVS